MPGTGKIQFEFRESKFFTRYPCHVCGGCTEKVGILTEAETDQGTIRVCESCLRKGDGIDARLRCRAKNLDESARAIRGLIGRLQLPTYAEWEEAERRFNDDYAEQADQH